MTVIKFESSFEKVQLLIRNIEAMGGCLKPNLKSSSVFLRRYLSVMVNFGAKTPVGCQKPSIPTINLALPDSNLSKYCQTKLPFGCVAITEVTRIRYLKFEFIRTNKLIKLRLKGLFKLPGEKVKVKYI